MPPGRQPKSTDVDQTSVDPRAARTVDGPSAKQFRPAQRSESRETQSKILDAAEALFIEVGFSATSFRAIAKRAGVNLSAAHYHFGSKEGLFGAALHRRVESLNTVRVANLEKLEARAEAPTVREVMEGYLGPLEAVGPDSAFPRLIARLYGEPESIQQPLVQQEFSATAERVLKLLGRSLPEIPVDELLWRFHFVIGSMIHLLALERPPILFTPEQAEMNGLGPLIDFATNALSAPSASAPNDAAARKEPKS